jgi:hypothetical protein
MVQHRPFLVSALLPSVSRVLDLALRDVPDYLIYKVD